MPGRILPFRIVLETLASSSPFSPLPLYYITPCSNCIVILANEEISNNALVRETEANLYLLLGKKGYTPDDILPFIVAPQPSLREVFELSLFLYGYYDEQYSGIRVNDKALYADWTKEQPELAAETILFTQESAWPLFLAAKKLDPADD
jgi:hypothetical protein